MLNIMRASLRVGTVTTGYPQTSDPANCRGKPSIDPARCDGSGLCARSCPSAAITLDRANGRHLWRLDLARCLFCGLCEEACSTGAIVMTHDFELAARARNDLVVTISAQDSRADCSHVDRGARADTGVGPYTRIDADRPRGSGEGTATRSDLSRRIRALLKRSLHVRHMAAGSDNSVDWEIAALLNPVYDVQRFGIDFVASPRHADLLLVTGAVTRHLEQALIATYKAMPAPRLVVAAGDEACGGGLLHGSYAVAGGVDRCLPVDAYIPGDPPRPEALIQGLLVAVDRLEPKLRQCSQSRGNATYRGRAGASPPPVTHDSKQ